MISTQIHRLPKISGDIEWNCKGSDSRWAVMAEPLGQNTLAHSSLRKSTGPSVERPPGCEGSPVSLIRCPLFLFSLLSILLIILSTQYEFYSLFALSKY